MGDNDKQLLTAFISGALTATVLVLTLNAIWQESKSSLVLNKSEWSCMEREFMIDGWFENKPNTLERCTDYRRLK